MTTPSPKDVESMITSSSGENGTFIIWTSIRQSSFKEWTNNNKTYEFSEIDSRVREMEHSLFQTNKPIYSPRK